MTRRTSSRSRPRFQSSTSIFEGCEDADEHASLESCRELHVIASLAMDELGDWPAGKPNRREERDVIAVDLPTYKSVAASIDEIESVKQFVDELASSGIIETFLKDHASSFGDLKEGAEMPLHYQEIHLKFVGLVETLLEEFVTEQGLDIESFIGLVERSGSESREQLLKAVDGMTDFESFLGMMREIKEGSKQDALASEFDQAVAVSS